MRGGFAYAVVDEGIGIEDLSIVEDTLMGLHITAIQTTEDFFKFVVCFLDLRLQFVTLNKSLLLVLVET